MSGRKNNLDYLVADNQSLGASFNSDPTLIKHLDNCSYQINVTTANAVGTFAVQASNDYDQTEVGDRVLNAGSWVDLNLAGGSGVPFVNMANDIILIDLNQLSFKAIRIAYTRTSGTGTCDILINAKQL